MSKVAQAEPNRSLRIRTKPQGGRSSVALPSSQEKSHPSVGRVAPWATSSSKVRWFDIGPAWCDTLLCATGCQDVSSGLGRSALVASGHVPPPSFRPDRSRVPVCRDRRAPLHPAHLLRPADATGDPELPAPAARLRERCGRACVRGRVVAEGPMGLGGLDRAVGVGVVGQPADGARCRHRSPRGRYGFSLCGVGAHAPPVAHAVGGPTGPPCSTRSLTPPDPIDRRRPAPGHSAPTADPRSRSGGTTSSSSRAGPGGTTGCAGRP